MKLQFLKVKAVTFDDFFTLRYPIGQEEDIIFPILKALKEGLNVNYEEFLKKYFREDELYRKRLKETLRESLLDDIVMKALVICGHESKDIDKIVKKAGNCGLVNRKAKWFPNVKKTLVTLKKKGYQLGLARALRCHTGGFCT